MKEGIKNGQAETVDVGVQTVLRFNPKSNCPFLQALLDCTKETNSQYVAISSKICSLSSDPLFSDCKSPARLPPAQKPSIKDAPKLVANAESRTKLNSSFYGEKQKLFQEKKKIGSALKPIHQDSVQFTHERSEGIRRKRRADENDMDNFQQMKRFAGQRKSFSAGNSLVTEGNFPKNVNKKPTDIRAAPMTFLSFHTNNKQPNNKRNDVMSSCIQTFKGTLLQASENHASREPLDTNFLSAKVKSARKELPQILNTNCVAPRDCFHSKASAEATLPSRTEQNMVKGSASTSNKMRFIGVENVMRGICCDAADTKNGAESSAAFRKGEKRKMERQSIEVLSPYKHQILRPISHKRASENFDIGKFLTQIALQQKSEALCADDSIFIAEDARLNVPYKLWPKEIMKNLLNYRFPIPSWSNRAQSERTLKSQERWNPLSIFDSGPPEMVLTEVFDMTVFNRVPLRARANHKVVQALHKKGEIADYTVGITRNEWQTMKEALREAYNAECEKDLDWKRDPLEENETKWYLNYCDFSVDKADIVTDLQICYCPAPNPSVRWGWNDSRNLIQKNKQRHSASLNLSICRKYDNVKPIVKYEEELLPSQKCLFPKHQQLIYKSSAFSLF